MGANSFFTFSRSPCLPCCCGGAFIVTRARYQWLLQDDTPGDVMNEAYTTRETHGFHVEWLPSRCREGARDGQRATLGELWWNLCGGSLIPFGFERETALHKVYRLTASAAWEERRKSIDEYGDRLGFRNATAVGFPRWDRHIYAIGSDMQCVSGFFTSGTVNTLSSVMALSTDLSRLSSIHLRRRPRQVPLSSPPAC